MMMNDDKKTLEIRAYVLNTFVRPGDVVHAHITLTDISSSPPINNILDTIVIDVFGRILFKNDSRFINRDVNTSSIITVMTSQKARITNLINNSTYEIKFTLPKSIPLTYNGAFVKIVHIIHMQGLQEGKRMRWSLKVPFNVVPFVKDNHANRLKLRSVEQPYEIKHVNVQPYRLHPSQVASPYASVYPWSFPYPRMASEVSGMNNNVLRTNNPLRLYQPSSMNTTPAHDAIVRQACQFNISVTTEDDDNDNNGHIGVFRIAGTMYYPGEYIRCVINMHDKDIVSYRMLITLEQEECFHMRDGNNIINTKVYAERHEYSSNLLSYSVQLKIPHTTTPTFNSDVIDIKWYIRVKFMIPSSSSSSSEHSFVDWKCPIIVCSSTTSSSPWRHPYHTKIHSHMNIPQSISDYTKLTDSSTLISSTAGVQHGIHTHDECYYGDDEHFYNFSKYPCTCLTNWSIKI